MIISNQHYKRTNKSKLQVCLVTVMLCLFASVAQAQFWQKKQPTLLPEAEAFQVVASIDESGLLAVDWTIAEDYYMYRDQFAVELALQAGTMSTQPVMRIGELLFPEGVVEDDPEFGEVEVYFYNALLSAPLLLSEKQNRLELVVKGQGCNKPVGVCYPPITRQISLEIPQQIRLVSDINAPNNELGAASVSLDQASNDSAGSANENANDGSNKSFSGYVLSAFLAGVLLSFTPCVLPMIPILAGVIAGQGHTSRWRSGWLAICYVGGTIVTYIFAGALAGATGAQLQAYFQNVWVVGFICLLLLLLAASLFGFYRIELPTSLQTRLNQTSGSGRSASISSFVLGLISALVVGACVSPVLILALGAAIQQGDPVLGGAIMGSMALGMGTLLILFGFGAGWILPRAGAWMNQIQILFGFMVLGVAIYLLGSFPATPVLYLWAGLLLVSGFYVWHLATQISQPISGSIARAVSALLVIWGAMSIIGGSLGGTDVLRPLQTFASAQGTTAQSKLPFKVSYSLEEVQAHMQSAQQNSQPILIDFYADWCLDCKRMDKTTFLDPKVQAALAGWQLIKIDVTDTSERSEEVKRYFEVFGPPATLFFSSTGIEIESLRQYGYINDTNFIELVGRVGTLSASQ